MQDDTSTKRTRRDSGKGARPYRCNGQFFNCVACGKQFYRKASLVKRGITRTCGASECKSTASQKENNSFWGKSHSPEVREALSKVRTARPEGKRRTGPPKGYKHTPEARDKMSAALRKRWAENRDVMLSYTVKLDKPREDQRYRKNFTPWQRREWKGEHCAWCQSTEELVLDHIVPVMDGGFNIRENAQTLCQPCNVWKMVYVDKPAHLARLALQGGLSC